MSICGERRFLALHPRLDVHVRHVLPPQGIHRHHVLGLPDDHAKLVLRGRRLFDVVGRKGRRFRCRHDVDPALQKALAATRQGRLRCPSDHLLLLRVLVTFPLSTLIRTLLVLLAELLPLLVEPSIFDVDDRRPDDVVAADQIIVHALDAQLPAAGDGTHELVHLVEGRHGHTRKVVRAIVESLLPETHSQVRIAFAALAGERGVHPGQLRCAQAVEPHDHVLWLEQRVDVDHLRFVEALHHSDDAL
eukprot:scaffold193_cov255-Pinguiococcus_pyrenoidosus.AAC.28